MNKTLIGKENVLFLINDSSLELKVHCRNLNLVKDHKLSHYTFKNIFIFVYPDKSVIYKKFLPDNFDSKFRPALNIYKKKFQNDLFDLLDLLKNETDTYYKTDTHINLKGNYIVYKHFINVLNSRLKINIKCKNIFLKIKKCDLSTLPYKIGDLMLPSNLDNQVLQDKNDNFYYNDEITWFYCVYKIKSDSAIRFLDYELNDKTNELIDNIANWNIIGNYILYKKNENKVPMKIAIIYDSFLLGALPLYFDLFEECFFIKSVYRNDLLDLIKPDFVFEFRVERFLF
jgi:hypothetical protein